MSTGIGLLAAGAGSSLLAAARGEPGRWNPAATPASAWVALAYLAAFGSVLGFSAYLYLLRRWPPSVVATYAFVNPLAAAAVVLAAVLLITTAQAAPRREGVAAGMGALPARRP